MNLGELVVNDLKPGDYQFVETKAPTGYQLNETPIDFMIEKGQDDSTEVVVKNVKQPVTTPSDKPSDKDLEEVGAGEDDPGSTLPKTATNLYNIIFAGMALLIMSITARFFRRKRNHIA